MKLFYSPPSPLARKVGAAAIELGLSDRLRPELTDVVPGRANRPCAEAHNPLRKVPPSFQQTRQAPPPGAAAPTASMPGAGQSPRP